MNELMVSLQGRGGNTNEDIFFCHAAKTITSSHMRFDGLGSKIGPKPPPKYHLKANIKGF